MIQVRPADLYCIDQPIDRSAKVALFQMSFIPSECIYAWKCYEDEIPFTIKMVNSSVHYTHAQHCVIYFRLFNTLR